MDPAYPNVNDVQQSHPPPQMTVVSSHAPSDTVALTVVHDQLEPLNRGIFTVGTIATGFVCVVLCILWIVFMIVYDSAGSRIASVCVVPSALIFGITVLLGILSVTNAHMGNSIGMVIVFIVCLFLSFLLAVLSFYFVISIRANSFKLT